MPGPELARLIRARRQTAHVPVLGELSAMPVYTSEHRLVPFVAHVPGGDLRPEPAEVAAILRADLGELLRAEVIDGLAFEWQGVKRISPIFLVEGHVVFGATAHTLAELLEVAAAAVGRERPPYAETGWVWTGTRPERGAPRG